MNATLQCALLGLALCAGGRALAQPLNANAGPDKNLCANAQVILGGSPAASGGNAPYAYLWSPATGLNNPTLANPLCTVNNTTTYTVTVTDDDGTTDTDQVTVTVLPAPDADLLVAAPAIESNFNGLVTFSLCDPALNWNFTIDDASAGAAGSTLNIDWGDGTADFNPGSPGWTTTHTYGQGLFTVTYTITPANGCTDVEEFQIFLGTNPGGGISTEPNTNICTGGSLPFYLNNVSSNTPGTSYLIDFGDGTTLTLQHPPPAVLNHQYDVGSCPGGSFTVYFTAQNPCDQTNGQISPIRVSETPVVDFTISPNDTACVNTTITFNDASLGYQAPACTDPKNLWSISPGTYSIIGGTLGNANGQPANPGLWTSGSNTLSVQFTAPGTYTITDVTGNVCGFDTLSRTICVEAPPVPQFTVSDNSICAGDPAITTDNTSTSANSCSIHYSWSSTAVAAPCSSQPGSAQFAPSSTAFEPSITFPDAGVYTIYLEAINSCGAMPVQQVVTVGSDPTVSLDPLAPICEGDLLFPTATANGCGSLITGTQWQTPGGSITTFTGNPHPGLSYASNGTPSVTVSVTNACGTASDVLPVVVNDVPVGVVASVLQDTICAGDDIQLLASNYANATYSWSGPGFSSALQDPQILNVTTLGTLTFTVVPVVGQICDGLPSTVSVVVLPADDITIVPTSAQLCTGDSILLTATGSSGYAWTANNAPAGNGASIWAHPASTTDYFVTGGGTGCPGTESITVVVNTPTSIVTSPLVLVCDQAIAEQLVATPSGGTWSGADIVNLTASGTVTPVPGNTGNDVLTYTFINGSGCESVAQTTVTVQAIGNPASAGLDTLVCLNGAAIELNGLPITGVWSGGSPWLSGSSFNPGASGVFDLAFTNGSGSCTTSDTMRVTVVAAQVVTADDLSICENALPVPLTSGSPVGGVWSGPGVTGSGPFTFDPTFGTQVLTYAFSDANGCPSSTTVTASVEPPPVANAGPDTTLCDQSIAFPLSGNFTGGVWSGGAPFVTQNPPQFTPLPDQFGTWTLTYTYTDPGGCTDSDELEVTVQDLTAIANAGEPDSVCANGGPVQLLASPPNGTWTTTAYLTADGLFDPAIAGAGPHQVTYCTGAGTCSSCDTRTLTVNAPPMVNAGPDLGFCVYEPVQDLMETPTGGVWSGTAGLVNTASGAFDPGVAPLGGNLLTYAYTDPTTGCINADQVNITVNEVPVAAFTSGPIACQYADFPFTDQSTGGISQWQWDLGDQSGTVFDQSPLHSYLDTGTFTVTLIVGTGTCTDTITGSVSVWPAPTVDMALDTLQGCGPLTVNFTNNSTGPGVSWTWDFGNGSGSADQSPPALTYPAGLLDDTTYTVSLVGENLCGAFMDQAMITVFPSPTAYFGPDFDSGCSPWPVTFSNVSVGQADSFEWLWGDGTSTITTDSLVLHTFTTDSLPVVRTVTLIATNSCGTDTATYNVLVEPNTITAFFNTDTTQGCAPLTVNFTQYSIGVTDWYWNLDGVNVSTAYNTSFTYDTAGIFTATLFGDNGCSYDTVSVQVTVHASPDVAFSFAPDPVCGNTPVLFSNLTPDVAATVWDFGDQTGSTLSIVEHAYALSGTYTVSLSAESSLNECSASATAEITVNPVPVAAFTPGDTLFCAPSTLNLVNTSIGNDLSSAWSVNGGIISYQTDPQPHTFSDAGTYAVELVVTDQFTGCTDSVVRAFVGNPTPTSSFTLLPVDACGEPAIVQATSTSTVGAVTQWYMDGAFVDGGMQLLYALDEPGEHTLALVAELPGACTDTSEASFTLYPLPMADFTTDTVCTQQSVVLHDLSTGFIGQWWYFNGIFVSTDPNSAAMIPSSLGTDTIGLSVMGEGGCMDSTALIVNVYASPPAGFTAEFIGDCQTVALAPDHITPYAEYLWSVNGTPWSHDLSTWYYYEPNTVESIVFNLEVTSIEGCSVPFQVVAPVPTCVYVPNSFTPDGDGLNEVFYASVLPSGRFRNLVIFDRWGQEIVTLDHRNPAWDGTENGEPLPIGVYNWRLTFTDAAEEQYGHVTLVR